MTPIIPNPKGARRIFSVAGDFGDAAKALTECIKGKLSGKGWPQLEGPMSVVAAFEVELYLKCILTDLGYPVPNLHDLKKLYDAIPKSEKAKIQKRFDSDPQQVAKALSVRMGLLAPEVVGLDAQLTICADAFEAWRYHFENPTRKLPVNNFSCLNFVLRGFILERHPDWGVDEDLYYESTCPAQ